MMHDRVQLPEGPYGCLVGDRRLATSRSLRSAMALMAVPVLPMMTVKERKQGLGKETAWDDLETV